MFVRFRTGREEEESSCGDAGRAASDLLSLPMAYPDLQGMPMDAHFRPDAQGDMGYRDGDPCELYPQSEQYFDAREASLAWHPGLTDVGSCISPVLTSESVGDDLINDYSPARRGWSFHQVDGSEDPSGEEEEILPPGFWKPNMLYETKAWWERF